MAFMKNVTPTSERWPTPPAVAQQFGVKPDKVIGWIRSGELKAVDLSTRRGGRPRYRIPPAELERFLAARAVTPPPKQTRRRRATPAGVREFF